MSNTIDGLYHCIPQFVTALDMQQTYYELVHKIMEVQEELQLCNALSILKERKAAVIDALCERHAWSDGERRTQSRALDTLLAISDRAESTDEYSVLSDSDDSSQVSTNETSSNSERSITADRAELETLHAVGTANLYIGTGTFMLTVLNLAVSLSTLVYVLDRFR